LKINVLKVNGFGKLKNKEITLDNHINLIYGENEAGKSTLLKFISGMFYGVSKNKNKKEYSDYDRYKPWNGQEFSGKMVYSLENDEKYEVFRDFSKKNPQIYKANGEEISKNFKIDKIKGNEFFYEQTKIDEDTFFSTTMITQKQVVLDKSEQQILTQKMANILSTGEETISYKKAIEKLNKKLLEEVGTERTTERPINIINKKIEKLNHEKNNIEINNFRKEELEKEEKEIEKEILAKNREIELIKEIKKIKEKNIIEEEKIKINKNLMEEENSKINELKEKFKNTEKIEKSKNYILWISIVLTVISMALIFIHKLFIVGTAIFTIIDFLVFVINYLKNKQKRQRQKEQENKIINEIEMIKNNIKEKEEKIESIQNEINSNIQVKIKEIKNRYQGEIAEEKINLLSKEEQEKLNNKQENLENSISAMKIKLTTNKIEHDNLIKETEEKIKIEEQLESLKEEKEELRQLGNAINIAKQALENAYIKMKDEITPKFTKTLSETIQEISGGKYQNIKFREGEGITVELENGEYIAANKLSVGTIDQLYLSLRLSAIEEITEEKMPIILDETFAYYDTERLTNILKHIHEKYKENQMIIFTCSNREKEILEKESIKYTYINLNA